MVVRLDNSEQKACANKIQISNIPIKENLRANDILLKISNKLQMNLSMDEIHETSILYKTNKAKPLKSTNADLPTASNVEQDISSDENDKGTASIMVNSKSLSFKKDFLTKFRKNKNIFFDDQNKFKIYINELLSYSRRRLFQNAKLFCKENNYDYAWISNGNILIEKKEGEKAIRIDANTDFTKIGELHDGEC